MCIDFLGHPILQEYTSSQTCTSYSNFYFLPLTEEQARIKGLQTFEGGGDTLSCAEGVGFREGPFPSFARCLDSEGVAREFRQSLDLVGVAGSSVD